AVVGLDFFAFNTFFERNQDVLEARFSGADVRAFADFLAAELAARQRNKDVAGDHEPPRTEVQPVDLAEPEDASADMEAWDEATYLAVNPDVAAAVGRGEFKSGREHYELAGRTERRKGGSVPRDWDETLYLRIYPDVAAEVRKGTFRS